MKICPSYCIIVKIAYIPIRKKNNANEKIEDVVVIFRGSSTNETEWSDNVLNANRVWSYPMDESVMYINNLPEEYGNNITVSGHSKGGNRAQYVTILTDRIGRCLTYDGQGFSDEFVEYYKDEIEEKMSIIHSISAEYDYVNCLLNPIAGTIEYISSICDRDYKLNHCPDRVFGKDGDLRN